MQIFHVFYAPKTGFNNAGNLYFWVEQSHGKIKKGYPYQLKREDGPEHLEMKDYVNVNLQYKIFNM